MNQAIKRLAASIFAMTLFAISATTAQAQNNTTEAWYSADVGYLETKGIVLSNTSESSLYQQISSGEYTRMVKAAYPNAAVQDSISSSSISRQDAITVLMAAKGVDVNKDRWHNSSSFIDLSLVSNSNKNAILSAYWYGICKGCSGYCYPLKPLTFVDACVFISRSLKNNEPEFRDLLPASTWNSTLGLTPEFYMYLREAYLTQQYGYFVEGNRWSTLDYQQRRAVAAVVHNTFFKRNASGELESLAHQQFDSNINTISSIRNDTDRAKAVMRVLRTTYPKYDSTATDLNISWLTVLPGGKDYGKSGLICTDYSDAAEWILTKCNFESFKTVSPKTDKTRHEWNMVMLNDQWWAFDATYGQIYDSDHYETTLGAYRYIVAEAIAPGSTMSHTANGFYIFCG